MKNEKTTLSPPSIETMDYKTRILTTKKTIKKIKEKGYDAQQALIQFPEILEQRNEALKETAQALTEKDTANATAAKLAADNMRLSKENRGLRAAIMVLNERDYWEVIRKAEKGYYQLVLENKK